MRENALSKWSSGGWGATYQPGTLTAGTVKVAAPQSARLQGVGQSVRLASGREALELRSVHSPPGFEAARVLAFDAFLGPTENAALYDWAIAQRDRFFPATVTADYVTAIDGELRRAKVIREFGEWQARMIDRVGALSRDVAEHLGALRRLGPKVEAELTAHNDADFFAMHADAGNDRAARLLTYVYYFRREPAAFAGGELRLFDSKPEADGSRTVGNAFDIEPVNDRLVLFLSQHLHEVRPIQCPTRRFEDGRFTVNGWVHRAPDPTK
jgi:SM-20-related protein